MWVYILLKKELNFLLFIMKEIYLYLQKPLKKQHIIISIVNDEIHFFFLL